MLLSQAVVCMGVAPPVANTILLKHSWFDAQLIHWMESSQKDTTSKIMFLSLLLQSTVDHIDTALGGINLL